MSLNLNHVNSAAKTLHYNLQSPEILSHLTEDKKQDDILLGDITVSADDLLRDLRDWLRTENSLDDVPRYDHVMFLTGLVC